MSLCLQQSCLGTRKKDFLLDVQGGSKLKGAKAIVYTAHGRDNQKFFFDAYGHLVPAHCTTLCMDVKGSKHKKGTPIIFWQKKDPADPNQRFELTEDGYLCSALGLDLVVGARLGPGKRSLTLVARTDVGALKWEWRAPLTSVQDYNPAEDDLEDDENDENEGVQVGFKLRSHPI